MNIVKRQIIISNREKLDILEIKIRSRLSYFSYIYRISDKSGINRPVVRWDNYGGNIHFETFDSKQHIIKQEKCEYKTPNEVLQLVKIFKHSLANMNINEL
jgi:hypothetical protein